MSEEEKEINSSKWSEMTIPELYEQKAIIGNRLSACAHFDNPSLLQQMERGLTLIQDIIDKKDQEDSPANRNIIT